MPPKPQHTKGAKAPKKEPEKKEVVAKPDPPPPKPENPWHAKLSEMMDNIKENLPAEVWEDKENFSKDLKQKEDDVEKIIKEEENLNSYFAKQINNDVFKDKYDLQVPFLAVKKATCLVNLEIYQGKVRVADSPEQLINLQPKINKELEDIDAFMRSPKCIKKNKSTIVKSGSACPILVKGQIGIEKNFDLLNHSLFSDIYESSGKSKANILKQRKSIEEDLNLELDKYQPV